MRALLINYHTPQPDRDSGSRRLYHFCHFLRSADWELSVLAADGVGLDRDVRALQRVGTRVYDGYRHALEQVLGDGPVDLALIAYWPNAHRFLPAVRELSPATRILVDSVDLHFVREARRLLRHAPGRPSGSMDEEDGARIIAELNAYAAADGVLTVSQKEADLVGDLVCEPGLTYAVPDFEDFPPSPIPFAGRRGMLWLGSLAHPPNRESIEYLCREIVPRLRPALLAKHPLLVVGNALDDEIRELARGLRNVQMIGWVPDVQPYLHAAAISVVPLLHGAGTKRKVIQALAAGTPTVSTSIGTEGLALRDREHVLVADDAAAFASAIQELLSDSALWSRLSVGGRQHVGDAHGGAAREAFLSAVQRTMLRPTKLAPQWDVQATVEESALDSEVPAPTTPGGAAAPEIAADTMSDTSPTGPVVETSRNGHQPRVLGDTGGAGRDVRLIAFYLPQFHPIPENDAWWGKGFTEWRHVAAANPLFPGHYQPHIPADLGFYDLRLAETRQAQADLARAHGIHGFCYYHYWFDSKRLLERPFQEVLDSGQPDFPFALCWANDPWSRRWDGREDDLLQAQTYSREDDLAHIRSLLPALSDRRAITIDGKPIFLVYRAKHLPEPERTTEIWRTETGRAGLPGIYLIAVETAWDLGWDATSVGFDAKVLFQPQFGWLMTHAAARGARIPVEGRDQVQVYDYNAVSQLVETIDPVAYRRYESIVPGWDNTSRVGDRAVVLQDSSPQAYGRWLARAVERARALSASEQVVFINAWNEWAEGNHLEPDRRHGRAYLEATKRALLADAQEGVAEATAQTRAS